MALTPHANWALGSYLADRNDFIKRLENPLLANGNLSYLQPYYDGSIAIGYGFDLLQRSVASVRSYITGVGGTFSPQAATLLTQYLAGTITNVQNLATSLRNYISLPSESAATDLPITSCS